MIKTSISLQELRGKIDSKAKTEKQRRFWRIFTSFLYKLENGKGLVSNLDLWRAQLRVVQSSGWKSRHGKKPEPCSVDGRGWWKRCLLKPIDKVCNRQASNYPGCNESERRSSLVKVQIHWPSLSQIGEDRILLPKLANR